MLKCELVRRMLNDPQKREEIDLPDPEGNTLLIDASREGNADLVHLLLRHGADPLVENHARETALSVAERGGFEEITEVLRECIAVTVDFDAIVAAGGQAGHA
jgi:ankyrin repeat protein